MFQIAKALIIVSLLLVPIPAYSITELSVCAEGGYEKMKNDFYTKFNETIVLSGVLNKGQGIMYIFIDKITSKWSVVILNTDKTYCLVLHGDGATPGHPNEVQYYEQSH